jgi:hypothetical protein
MAAVGLLGKVAVGFVALIVLVGAVLPSPSASPDARARSESGGRKPPSDAVVLRVPDGEPAGHLTVVDAAGREIAKLTHWSNGHTAVVTRRDVGPTVGYYHKAEGWVGVLVSGTAGETRIEVESDGTTKASASDPSGFINPPTRRGATSPPVPGSPQSPTARTDAPDGED